MYDSYYLVALEMLCWAEIHPYARIHRILAGFSSIPFSFFPPVLSFVLAGGWL